MSILAQNMKTIRKELKCTQAGMAEILNIGFRTYVRYEAGERDAPVRILVKMARLANVSLEHLLTQKLETHHISPVMADRLDLRPPEIKSCNLQKGTVRFKKSSQEGLITLDEEERRLLTGFRKLSPEQQTGFLKSMGRNYKPTAGVRRKPGALTKRKREEARLQKENQKMLAQAAAITPAPGRRKGKPGRKKLDPKSLREKVATLKRVTRTAPKITVR